MKNTFRFLFVVFTISISTNSLRAQWVQTNGPYGGDVRCFVVSGTNLFAGTYGGGIFHSTNNGVTWTAVNSGLTNVNVRALIVSGTNLFAGTEKGIFRSTDNGTSWTESNSGLTNTYVFTFALSGTNIFVGVFGGVYLSTNNGTTWSLINNGLTNAYVYSLVVSGTNLFAGTYGGGVFRSTNNGTTWTAVNNGLTTSNVLSLIVSGTNLFAGTYGGGVYLSTNNGASWINTALSNAVVWSLAVYPQGTGDMGLLAGASGGVYLSTNDGISWSKINFGSNSFIADVLSLGVIGTNLLAGTQGRGVYRSTNNGTNWTESNTGLTNTRVTAVALSTINLFVGTGDGKVSLSTNNGTSWVTVNSSFLNNFVETFAISGTNIFVGTYGGGVYRSTNNGTNWTSVYPGASTYDVRALAVSGSNLFAGTYAGVFRSTDNGTSWTIANSGLGNSYVRAFGIVGTNLFAGTRDGGVFLSTNDGTSWVKTGLTNTHSVFAFAVSLNGAGGTNLFAGTEGGIFRSTDNGTSWTESNSGLTNTVVFTFALSGTNIFAGTSGGIFLSTNNGTSWTAVNTGLTNIVVPSLAVSGTNLFAGTNGNGVWRRPLVEMIEIDPITLISPGNTSEPGYTIATLSPSFFWNGITSASHYGLQLYKQVGGVYDLVYNSDIISTTSVVLPAGTIADASQYYWQVRARVANIWSSYSSPYYFSVSVASLTPTILLSSSLIQTGEMLALSGINFSGNNQARAMITSDNGYDTTITINTNAIGYITRSLTLTVPGIYTIYCRDLSTQNLSNSKSFEVRSAAPISYFSIIFPYSGYQSNANEPVSVEWKDKLARGNGYPIVGSQRGYNFLVDTSSNNGGSWQLADAVSGFDDIDKIRTFRASITIAEPVSNCLIRIRDGYLATRTTASVPIHILSITPSNLAASFVWDYSYPANSGQPIGVAADGTGRFYIKVSDPGKTISQVTFSLFDLDNNNETRTLGKLKAATNITSYDEEANNADQLSITVAQPHANSEFWCWYVAPDDFIGLNTSIGSLTSRKVKVKIRAEYASGPFEEIIKTITIKRPPVVLVHGLNSSPSIWFEYVFGSSYFYFNPTYTLKIDGQGGFDDNARLLLFSSDRDYSLPARINHYRNDNKISCNQVYYVGHSMGGTVLRFAQSHLSKSFYNPNNYQRGYVNKFVTLDTPHRGSPLANKLIDLLTTMQFDQLWIPLFGYISKDFYRTGTLGFITDVHPAIRDLRMNAYILSATNYKSHVFAGDVVDGLDNFANVPRSAIASLNISSSLLNALKYLTRTPTQYRMLSELDSYYSSFSGSNSIANSDFIVPLNSQLSDLLPDDDRVTYTVNFHSASTGSPSIESNTAEQVAALLDTRRSSSVWGSLPALQQSSSYSLAKSAPQHTVMDTSFIHVFAPRNLDTLYIDSVFNLAFSLSDTANLKRITVIYQDKFIEDTVKQTNYNYSLSVSNNFIDTQSVAVIALYSSNDSTIVSSKVISVIIRSSNNPLAIKSKENFVYLLKDENYYPDVNIYFQTFIGKIGTTGTALDVVVEDPGLLSYNDRTKTITALRDGGTFAVFDYRGLRDTVYFKINGESITGLVEGDNTSRPSVPIKCQLFQNYPNPFNPITTIRYSIPSASVVKLQVYDVLGRQVGGLVSEEQFAGNYSVTFNGGNLAGGVYFYRLQAGDFVETKKLVLLR